MLRFDRPEHIVFLASVQSLEAIASWSPPDTLPEAIDWSYIFNLSVQHKSVPLLHYLLKKHPALTPPPEVEHQIEQYVRQQALANVFQTNELIRILTHLENTGIECIPFKGPSLGMYLYGELAYRPFGDLDILIHKEDFPKVKEHLVQLNYTPFRSFSQKKEKAFLKTQMGYEFVRKDERCVVEVHWSLLNKIHVFNLHETDLWAHKKRLELQGKSVYRFTDEHLFVYLCAHGSKSFWARLRWLTDIAELIAAYTKEPDAEKKWESILKTAHQSNSTRMVYLGIYLAHTLLNAPVPPDILNTIEPDPVIKKLSDRVYKAIFVKPAQQEAILKPVSFHLLMQKSIIHRMPYLSHIARLWVSPTRKDKSFIKLPSAFAFLYIVVKPFRILKNLIKGTRA